jgi:hypothetical protein
VLFHDAEMRAALYKDAVLPRGDLGPSAAVVVHGIACATKLRWLPTAHPSFSYKAIEVARRRLMWYIIRATQSPEWKLVTSTRMLRYVLLHLGPHCREMLEVCTLSVPVVELLWVRLAWVPHSSDSCLDCSSGVRPHTLTMTAGSWLWTAVTCASQYCGLTHTRVQLHWQA